MEKINDLIKESGKNINLLEFETYYLINYNDVNSKIMKKTLNSSCIVLSNDKHDYDFYDKLNRYCFEKNPSEHKVF